VFKILKNKANDLMSEFSKKRILITGAAGFVGANMVRRLLDEKADVFALFRPETDCWRLADIKSGVTKLECNLLDLNEVEKCVSKVQPEYIYNFAFPGGYPSTPTNQINMLDFGLVGTFTLLNAARKNGVKVFVQINSSTEYGLKDQPHRETDLLEPITLRGVSKAASTLLCQQYAREHHMRLVILRLFSVYGPWEQPNRLIPTICKSIMEQQSLKLTPKGIMHDWVFVDDVIEACYAAASNQVPPGEIFNIGSGEQYANEEVVKTLCEVSGQKIEIVKEGFKSYSHDTFNWVADIHKAHKMLCWSPRVSLQKGLELSFEFWKGFLAKKSQ
jgi:nucleoside-diphosphate-sugar epimerase